MWVITEGSLKYVDGDIEEYRRRCRGAMKEMRWNTVGDVEEYRWSCRGTLEEMITKGDKEEH
jgi:hypothetical protein